MSHNILTPGEAPILAPEDPSPTILVVGSANTDMVVKTRELPGPGETVLGGAFFMNPGGKGANQAVAAARLQAPPPADLPAADLTGLPEPAPAGLPAAELMGLPEPAPAGLPAAELTGLPEPAPTDLPAAALTGLPAAASARLPAAVPAGTQAAMPAIRQSKVAFLTRLGADIFGAQTKDLLIKEGIDPRCILTDTKAPSGVALITVNDKGENCIAVAPGANANLGAQDIEAARDIIETATIVLVQLEIPLETVIALVETATRLKKLIILNPAPARPLPDSLLGKITILTPNEKEAEQLTGIPVTDIDSATKAARTLQSRGVHTVIITLGKNGALLHNDTISIHLPAPRVEALDTTAAGDVFNGALAVALATANDAAAQSIIEAVGFANHAAALSVTRLGAQASAPTRAEVEAFMRR